MTAEEVAIYADANGNTWQLTAAQAKARGFKAVKAEVKVVEPEAVEAKIVTPARAANKARRKK